MIDKDITDKFENLRKSLLKIDNWPCEYMFKFIIPNNPFILLNLREMFTHRAEFRKRFSSGNTYLGITFVEKMPDANSIIEKYRKITAIDGVLMAL